MCALAWLNISHFHIVCACVFICVCVLDFVFVGAAQDPGAGHHWAWGTRVEPSWGGTTDFQHCGHWLDLWWNAVLTLGSEESLHLRVVFAEVPFPRWEDLTFPNFTAIRVALFDSFTVGVSLPWQILKHPLQTHLHILNVNFPAGNPRVITDKSTSFPWIILVTP